MAVNPAGVGTVEVAKASVTVTLIVKVAVEVVVPATVEVAVSEIFKSASLSSAFDIFDLHVLVVNGPGSVARVVVSVTTVSVEMEVVVPEKSVVNGDEVTSVSLVRVVVRIWVVLGTGSTDSVPISVVQRACERPISA